MGKKADKQTRAKRSSYTHQAVRLYTKAEFTGIKRGERTHEKFSMLKIKGVIYKKFPAFYF